MRREEYERDQAKKRQRVHSGTAPGRTLEVDLPQGRGPQTRDPLATRADVPVNKQAQTVEEGRVRRQEGEEKKAGGVPLKVLVGGFSAKNLGKKNGARSV